MKLSAEEKAAHRAAFHNMNLMQKADYVFSYYRFEIVLAVIALVAAFSLISAIFFKKDPVLYAGLVNISAGEDLTAALTKDIFADESGGKTGPVTLFANLYVSDDASAENHEYAYSSSIKIMGAIQAGNLDLVIMNKEACEWFSGRGYLLDLTEVLSERDPELLEGLAPYIRENSVVLEDNRIDRELNLTDERIYDTAGAENCIEINQFPVIEGAGFDGSVYLGIIANTARLDECLSYIRCLMSPP